MRIALVVIALAGIAVGLVHMRRVELTARHETRCLELQRIELDGELSRQATQLEQLTNPAEVRRRGQEMVLDTHHPRQRRTMLVQKNPATPEVQP